MDVKDPEFFKELLQVFILESKEHITTMSDKLTKLGNEESTDKREEIYEELTRAGHSLKGAARTMGIFDLESIGFSFEKLFGKMKSGGIILSDELNKNVEIAISNLSDMVDTLNDKGEVEGDKAEIIKYIETVESQID